jgi:alkylated DNA repair dioxygenase AlkB
MKRSEKYGITINKNCVRPKKSDLKLSNGDVLNGISFTIKGKSGNNSQLIWYKWPKTVPIPTFPTTADYHKVRTGMQPRKTVCYGTSYNYSGLKHPLEKDVPDDIQNLINYTNIIYDVKNELDVSSPITMCLANLYPTYHHSISKHSDDESQFSYIRDVICWVVGNPRTLIIRPKTSSDIILSLDLPQGIYIMKGEWFQSDFTHEIPKKKETLFKKLSILAPNELSTLEKADWLSNNKKIIKEKLPDLYRDYKDWNSSRASYTIRYFEK